ncbi:MAG TPA: DnaA/Hda family protein, partial [Planctomycetota bacterium]|nr:DnaA/Hda family protein [Planctomycetota bacterium]
MVSFGHLADPFANDRGRVLAKLRTAIQSRLGHAEFESWYHDVRWHVSGRESITIEAANQFRMRWIEREHLGTLRDAIRDVLGPTARLELRATKRPRRAHNPSLTEPRTSIVSRARRDASCDEAHRAADTENEKAPEEPAARALSDDRTTGDAARFLIDGSDPLRADSTFTTFIAGAASRVAYAAALSVAERPGALYNPLVVVGAPGTGKTHLLQALCRSSIERSLGALYISGASFAARARAAAAARDLDSFRRWLREADVLLIDGVDDIAAGSRPATELFLLLEERIPHNRQVVLSSIDPPSANPLFAKAQPFLASALIPQLEFADPKTREEVLRLRARERGFDLADDVIDFLARELADEGLRELEGTMYHLLGLFRSQGGVTPTLELARATIEDVRSPRVA